MDILRYILLAWRVFDQDLGSSSEHQYRDMSVDKKGNRVATPSRQQIALAEMESVANQEPRLKNYLNTQRHACC